MDPPLRERLRWRNATRDGVEPLAERATMARAAALFSVAAALVCLIGVVVPGETQADDDLLLATAGGAALLAVLILIVFERIPRWVFHVLAASGTALASLMAYGWGAEAAYGPLPYVWVVLFVFYFFSRPAALVYLALMAAGYALALAEQSLDESPLDGWIATVLTLLVTGLFVSVVRDRLSRLVARLSDAAHRDPLTRLLNSRGFQDAFDVELERVRRADQPLSLIVGDLDHFTPLVEAKGRSAGDTALECVADAIRGAKRGFDRAARVGREQFAVLAPDCDEHGAYTIAERIRAAVERECAGLGDPPLTISFGISAHPLHGQSVDALLRAADQALFAAKRLGRNRSVISSAEAPGARGRAARTPGTDAPVDLAALLGLAEALDVRDSGSASHSRRVGRLAELTARELGLPPEAVERVRLAGVLHDVGRVGVPESLLAKPGPLTEEEWSWMRSHPAIGARMVATTEYDDIRSWILFHHERPDGSGYPEGRREEEIPLESSIIGVADAYEAMRSRRPYRDALAPDEAADELRREAGHQFRRDVVEALLRAL